MRATLAAALLLALPAFAVEGAVSAEITLGRQFALNANFELSPIEDRLWLVVGYGLLKSPDLAATDTTPKVTTAASHLFSGGVDVSPHRQWVISLLAQGSPRAGETIPLNPGSAVADRVSVSTSRQSAGGSGMLAFDSAGDSAFEVSIDAGAGFTWNRLGRTFTLGPLSRIRLEDLFVTRPQLGLSVVIKDNLTLSVRGGYTFYSTDPLSVGRFTSDDLGLIGTVVADRLSTDVGLAQGSANTALSRLASFDAVSGYPYAPVRVDVKGSVQYRFSRLFTLGLSWSYLRYVPTQGFGNVLALKAQFRISKGFRAWAIIAGQLDEPLDAPAARTETDPKPSLSGHLSIGGEFGF